MNSKNEKMVVRKPDGNVETNIGKSFIVPGRLLARTDGKNIMTTVPGGLVGAGKSFFTKLQ